MLLTLICAIGINMPDDKMIEAYKMAQQMDDQSKIERDMDTHDNANSFLDTISKIESSGGTNFNHEEIQNGMHKGHRAAGRYGLMPNTINETLNRMRTSGQLTPELDQLNKLDPNSIKSMVEGNPELEQQLAMFMAKRALVRQNDDQEKAAYSWFQGHNLTPDEIEERDYKDHDYVKKYNKYKGS